MINLRDFQGCVYRAYRSGALGLRLTGLIGLQILLGGLGGLSK